jgi:membrane-bound metal-dependent hydrolase YbcI (DUF457 family)
MYLIGAHLAAGLLIGKLTGNYVPAVIGALFLDLDHIIPYIKHGAFSSVKKFFKTTTMTDAGAWDDRNYFHSLFSFFAISAAVYFINFEIGITFSLGYLSHLVLDSIDSCGIHLFYPIKAVRLHGPIGYFSKAELWVTFALFAVLVSF